MTRRLFALLAGAAFALSAPAAAQAAEQQAYAAGLNYATPAVGAASGDTLYSFALYQ